MMIQKNFIITITTKGLGRAVRWWNWETQEKLVDDRHALPPFRNNHHFHFSSSSSLLHQGGQGGCTLSQPCPSWSPTCTLWLSFPAPDQRKPSLHGFHYSRHPFCPDHHQHHDIMRLCWSSSASWYYQMMLIIIMILYIKTWCIVIHSFDVQKLTNQIFWLCYSSILLDD